MKIIKKYTAIVVDTKTVDEVVQINLYYGRIEGPYYSRDYPEQEFDTEEEAIQYAYKKDKYSDWLIVPIVKFDNH